MPFKRRAHESLQQGVRALAREQLRLALDQCVKAADGNVDESVHEIRKSLKRLRSILRLARRAIGKSAYRFENEALCNVARPLSAIRDSKVLSEALGKLQARAEGADAEAFKDANAALARRRQRIHAEVIIRQRALQAAEQQLGSALERVNDWTRLPRKWRALAKAVSRVYRQGRDAYHRAQDDPTVSNLHQWRKQVKFFRYQLELLALVGPMPLSTLVKQAEELGDVLGEDHDLAVLGAMLGSREEGGVGSGAADVIQSLIADRRKELLHEAMDRGELLHRHKPRQLAAELKRCWKRWSAHGGTVRTLAELERSEGLSATPDSSLRSE